MDKLRYEQEMKTYIPPEEDSVEEKEATKATKKIKKMGLSSSSETTQTSLFTAPTTTTSYLFSSLMFKTWY